jgi:hypothetical protein
LRVRNKLLQEIAENKAAYTRLQGGKKSIEKIIQALEVETLTTSITEDKWLNKFSHGHMIANSYRRLICFISLNESHSFFPLQLGPTSEDPAPVYLIYINGNHWVLGDVAGEDGVKPIPPPFLAPRHTSKNIANKF